MSVLKKIGPWKVHAAANFFPLLEGEEFDAFVEDIRQNGQREPAIVMGKQLLDGRNRARACVKLKRKLVTRAYTQDDPVGLVISLNLKRRHLNESQRAMAAARILEVQADDKSGKFAGQTQAGAARLLNTSERSVRHANRVLSKAVPELREAVDRGHVAVSLASELVKRPPKDQKEVAKQAADGAEAPKVVREIKRKARASKMGKISRGNKALEGRAQYGLVYADPPWKYKEGTTTPNRRIDNHYPPMALGLICKLPVGEIAFKEAARFMWVPTPLLFDVVPQVLEAWGFDYKSSFVWHKTGRLGAGHYARIDHEHLLICTRGDVPVPAPSDRRRSVVSAPVGKPSEKPAIFYDIIEKMYPEAAKIELFARGKRKGWSSWGNQA